MNTYIILWLILITIGSGLTIYGGNLKNKIDSEVTSKATQQKIEEVLSEINTVKNTTTDPGASKSLETIEDDFKDWASQFLKNKETKK